MKCDECELLLQDYLDHQLDQQQTKLVQEHIEHCEACRMSYEMLSQMVQLMGQLDEEIDVPQGLHGLIMDAIANEASENPTMTSQQMQKRSRTTFSLLRPFYRYGSTVAAVVMVLVVVGAMTLIQQYTHTKEETASIAYDTQVADSTTMTTTEEAPVAESVVMDTESSSTDSVASKTMTIQPSSTDAAGAGENANGTTGDVVSNMMVAQDQTGEESAALKSAAPPVDATDGAESVEATFTESKVALDAPQQEAVPNPWLAAVIGGFTGALLIGLGAVVYLITKRSK